MGLIVLLFVVFFASYANSSSPFFFDQRVDHFSSSSATFKQKYYVLDFSKIKSDPVFLYISGEAPLNGVPMDYVRDYAMLFNATVVTLEHRYYGSSIPTSDASRLPLLTVEQALADLANFVTWFSKGRPVVTFGISYSGALSAWFRVRYSNVTLGSVSSSGVVNPIVNFFEFDQQTAVSLATADPVCLGNLRSAMKAIESELQTNPTALKAMFGAESLTNDLDFLYYVADASAETVQYGYQSTLCSFLNDENKTLIQRYQEFLQKFFNQVYLGGDVGGSYSRQEMAKVKFTASRSWWWQTCYELGYFNTAPPFGSIRSSRLNLEYFEGVCNYLYPGVYPPDASKVIKEFGGTFFVLQTNFSKYLGAKPNGTNIVFFQGSQDQWQWAGVRHTLNAQETEYTMVCDNCGHGCDIRGCPSLPMAVAMKRRSSGSGCDNEEAINEARQTTISKIKQWLNKK